MSVQKLLRAASSLRDDADVFGEELTSSGTVDCVYNPLSYAWEVHKRYIEISGDKGARAVMMGMNPGPHGMGQMGIPFAATSMVRDILGISGIDVNQPSVIHPKRPVIGLDYPREEVSGTRIWGLLSETYGGADEIFGKVFLVNHCPLMLLDGERGSNITPDKIYGDTAKGLLRRCDEHLVEVVEILDADVVIGIGKFAEKRARDALDGSEVEVRGCWHPSPASPLANRNGGADWRENVRTVLP
ncbi:MAG: single-stranded DNA-binding protein [Euryarchaeota archaeon]|nr:single-stranded DNA-binding protein [Euryarchaeota archaeon]|tara:strand:+ start:3773 stop:4504 length:732 start_codon:yes stop_codon:yes gene_type:complete